MRRKFSHDGGCDWVCDYCGAYLNNQRGFTIRNKADKPAIAFDLPAYRYVGDSVSVKTTLTGAEAVTWELTRDGKSIAMPEGFTKDGGICFFMEAGRYTLKGTVENSGGTAFCEKTVEVLPMLATL